MHQLGNPEDDLLDVHGIILTDDPGPNKEVVLCRPQGLGKVHWNGTIGIDVIQKVLCAENFGPGPVGGRGGGGA